MTKTITVLISCIFLLSCSEGGYTPKPTAYPRIERETPSYVEYKNEYLSFVHPNNAVVEPMRTELKNNLINISYKQYGANIYCTYIPLEKTSLREVLDDNYRLVYAHTTKASEIQKTEFKRDNDPDAGIVYEIKGNVATPIQFYITDGISNFFRGSLYYDKAINIDSVAPITQFIKEDIISIMESLKWGKRNSTGN